MTANTARILVRIRRAPGGVIKADDLCAFIGERDEETVEYLRDAGLIEVVDYKPGSDGLTILMNSFRLTVRGAEMLEAHQEAVEKERRAEADKNREKEADDVKAIIKEKKSFRNNLKVAAFTVVLTLLLEHCMEVFQFLKTVFKAVMAFFSE